MKKKLLVLFAIVCSLVTFGQDHKKGGWDISVGPSLFAPMSHNIDWNSKAWGENVKFHKKNMVVSLGYMQNKNGFVQVPVLVGGR